MLRYSLPLLIVLLTGCLDPPPPPAAVPFKAALEAQDREGLKPKEDKGPAIKPQGPLPALTLKRGLPPLKRNTRYSWGHTTTLIDGHLGARLVEGAEKTSESEGVVVMTFLIDDLIDNPTRRELLAGMPRVLKKFPGEVVEGAWIKILVAERFEVTVKPEHPSYARNDKMKAWVDRMMTSELVKLAAPEDPKKKR